MTDINTNQNEDSKKPDFVVKTPQVFGHKSRLVRIGAGWQREDGGICLRLVGKQIIEDDLYIYPTAKEEAIQEGLPSEA